MSSPWLRMRFSEAVEVNPRRTVKRGTITPFVDMATLSTEAPHVRPSRSKSAGAGGSRFRNGDTLLARITPCTENGKTGLVDGLATGEVGTGSTEFIVLGPRHRLTFARFVYYLAKHPAFRSFAISQMRGTSGRQRVPASVFDDYMVGVPSLPEQRKIAAILSSLDDVIETTQAVIDQLQVVKRGLMQELLTRGLPGRHTQFKPTEIGNVPKAWDVLPLRDFVETGPENGLYRPQSDYGEGVPIVRIDTFNNGDVLRRPTLRRVSLDHAVLSRFVLRPGDILINRVNSMSHLAKCALAGSFDEATVYESNMMRLALDDSRLTKKYGFLWLSSEKVKAYLKRRAKRAVAQVSINQTDVLAIPTPCPPREEQQAIAEVIGNTERRIESEDRTLGGLRELKSALMSVLLTGELRVTPDPEPE